MRESDVERKFVRKLKEAGCLPLKFVSPGYTGVPDRIILIPGGSVAFAELKAPGEKERPRQRYVQGIMRKLGCVVFSAVDSDEKTAEVVRYVEEVKAWNTGRTTIRDT